MGGPTPTKLSDRIVHFVGIYLIVIPYVTTVELWRRLKNYRRSSK